MLSYNFIIIGFILNVLCVWSIDLLQQQEKQTLWKKLTKYLSGGVIGIMFSFFCKPISVVNTVIFAVLGCLFSEILVLFFTVIKNTFKKEELISYYDDGSPAKFFITGDKHRKFSRIKSFCRDMNTRRKDVLIILGDAGFNYYDDERDDKLKSEISALNITLFCLHGNKENRPQNIATYGIRSFCGGKVYYEPKYPNILFAIDGEIYTFEGKKYMVVGGAHSVDKLQCLEEKRPFWFDEMPDDVIKSRVEERLTAENNTIYGMLTHTCPIDYLPTEMFVSTRQNAVIKRKPRKAKSKKMFKPDIDRSTEIWLGELEKKINFEVWFCGHYHIDKQIDKIQMLCYEIRPLCM